LDETFVFCDEIGMKLLVVYWVVKYDEIWMKLLIFGSQTWHGGVVSFVAQPRNNSATL
jgi:hypothetical protein